MNQEAVSKNSEACRDVYELLSKLQSTVSVASDRLKVDNEALVLISNQDTPLAHFSETDVKVAGYSLKEKLTPYSSETTLEAKNVATLLDKLGDNLVRLNHLGIRYKVANLETEAERIFISTQDQGLELYREPVPTVDNPEENSWLFVGDKVKENWGSPLFELVLSAGESAQDSECPHLQIDVDTSLSIVDIKDLVSSVFPDIPKPWELDIAEAGGVVLQMYTLGKINGIPILLGIGTDKRSTEFHRKEGMEQV